MDETKVRVLLREWAERAPDPDPTIPPSVLGRSRRRVARNTVGAVLAMALIAFAAVAGVRAFVRTGSRRPATPVISPLGTHITIVSATHIFLAKPDGSETVRVAAVPARLRTNGFVPLAWSPDGTRLLVRDLADDTIAVMNTDGTGLMYLAGGVDASWSPDGKKILVASGHGRIYLMNPDGSDYNQLGTGKEASFSPHGDRLSLVVTTDPPSNGIFVIGPLSVDQARLDPDKDAFADGSASWAPKETRIAIASYTSAKGWRIYVVGPSGGGLRYLVPGSEPSWSPDGTRIVFTSRTADGNEDIYVIGADGSGLTRLTSDPARDTRPSWSPDGSKIAFFSARDGHEGIYVMSPDGSDQRFLGSFPSTAQAVVWRITGG